MKKKIDNPSNRSNKHWNQEELQIVKKYYGAIKTDDLAQVIDRSATSIRSQCATQQIPMNERIYAQAPIEITYQGRVHQVKAFRYTRKDGITVDKTVTRRPTAGRPKKLYIVEPKKEYIKRTMAAHRRKPSNVEKKPELTRQIAQIKEFKVPEGKKLTMIAKGLYKYL